MQLTCRDWAAATAPTELCVSVPAWKKHAALAGVLLVEHLPPHERTPHCLIVFDEYTVAYHLRSPLAIFLLLLHR